MKTTLKKMLSVFLSLLMILTMIPVITLTFRDELTSQAYSSYSKTHTTEYHYDSGTNFIYQTCLYYDSDSNSDATNWLKNNGWTPVGGNFNAGDGKDSKYIHLGVKYTTDPTVAVTGFQVRDSSSRPNSYTAGYSATGATVTWYKVGSGAITQTPDAGDGSVDLNKGGGGNDLTLYVTIDYNAGPAVTDYTQTQDDDSQPAKNALTNNGWTVAWDQNGNWQDCNEGSGGDYLYEGYKSTCTTVSTDSLRTAYANGVTYYNNSSRYVSVSTLNSALSTANSILADVNDGYTTYTQTQINNATTAINNALNALQTYVYLNANGGSGGGTDTVTVGTNTTVTYTTSKTATRTGYTFKGWASSTSATSGSTSLQACFKPTYYAAWLINTYTITFKGADGTVLKTQTCNYNTTPTAPSIPAKAYDGTYHYSGAWDQTIVAATANKTYTVVYTGTAHNFSTYVSDVTAATCVSNKTATYKCTGCAATTVKTVSGTTLAHSYTGAVLNNNDGTHSYKCVNGCGNYGNATSCTYTSSVLTPANCYQMGTTRYTCSVCGYYYDVQNIPTVGHVYGAWVKDSGANTHTKVCTVCPAGTAGHTVTESCTGGTADCSHLATCTVCGSAYGNYGAHSMTKTKAVAPTCTTGGNNEYYTCSICNNVYKDNAGTTKTTVAAETLAALGHNMTKTDAKAATCIATGNNAYYTCSRCTKVFTDVNGANETTVAAQTIAQKAHSYTGAVKNNNDGTHSYMCVNGCNAYGGTVNCSFNTVVTAPTCTAKGFTTYTCTACGYVKTGDETGMLAHTYTVYVAEVTPATCLANATATYKCENCTATTIKEVADSKLDHSYTGAIKDNGDATHSFKCVNGCNNYGEAIACEYVIEDELVKAATCLDDAIYTYYCECGAERNLKKANTKLDHDYSGAIKSNGKGMHSFKCVNGCDGYSDAVPCEYTTECELVTAATCLANAVYTYSCECGAEKNLEKAGTKLDHDFSGAIKDNGDGTHSFKCVNGCDDYGNATACDYVNEGELVTAATCLKNAVYTYSCECGAEKNLEKAGTKLDHDFSGAIKNNGDGTHSFKCVNGCDDYGNETACDYVNEGELVTAATCLKNAVYTYSCECGAEKNLEKADTKLDHDFSGAIKNNGDGTHSYKCVNGCDDYGATVSCTNFSEKVTAPTCTAKGFTTYTCDDCGYEYTADETAMLAHTYTVYVEEVTPATCLVNATATYKCENCDATTVKEVADTKLEHDFSGAVKDNGDGTHSFKCVNGCDDYGNTTACDYVNEGELVTAATCLANAVYTYSCECGAEKNLEKADTKLDHAYTGAIKNNEDGTHSFKCVNGCDAYGNETACDYVNEGELVTAATCLKNAVYTYSCECGAEKNLEKAGTKLDHAYTGAIKNNEDGTHSFKCVNGCDAYGNETACDYVNEGELVTAATCLANAVYTYSCECGAEKNLEKAGTKLDHAYTGAIKNNEDGTHSFKCVNGCDNYGGTVKCSNFSEKVTKNPECTVKGTTTYTCKDCGYTYSLQNVKELGHDYSKYVVNQPTCVAEGLAEYVCSRCSDSYTEPLEKVAHNPGSPVIENRVYGSGDTVGHYDSVVYCTECGTELSRTLVTSEGDCPACPLEGVSEELGSDTIAGRLVAILHAILHAIFSLFDNVIGG